VTALPIEWKKKILKEGQNFDFKKAPFYIAKRKDKYEYKNLTVATIYELLKKPKKIIQYKFRKWAPIYCKSINDKDWENLFVKIDKRNSNNKASEIIFKIAHFLLPTNETMFNKGLRNDKICPQCKKHDEDIFHMMYKCEKVQPLILFSLDILDQLYPVNYPHCNTFKFILFGYGANAGCREFSNIL